MEIDQNQEAGGMSGGAELVRQGYALVKAENDQQSYIATMKPRDVARAVKNALAELTAAPEWAAKTYYSIPFKEGGGSGRTINVEGVGHPGAMIMARNWGNLSLGCRIIDEDAENIYLEGVLMDYETNVREMRPYQVKKKAYRKSQAAEITLSARELVMAVGSGTSKAIRNVILAYMPPAMKEQFFRKSKELAALSLSGKGAATPEQRLDIAIAKFAQWGITQSNLFAYLKVASKKEITEEHLGSLVGLFNALDNGETTKDDIIGDATIAGVSEASTVIANAKAEEKKVAAPVAKEKPAAKAKAERPMPDALKDVEPAERKGEGDTAASIFDNDGKLEPEYSKEFNQLQSELGDLAEKGAYKEDILAWGKKPGSQTMFKAMSKEEQKMIAKSVEGAIKDAQKRPVE